MNKIPASDAIVGSASQNEAFRDKARVLRPFYFIVVAWGKRYIDFLCNFCIASLLSPNNIPALLNSGNKFLIATTDEDWAQMQSRPIFDLLRRSIEPVFIRIPPNSEGASNFAHMGIGHKIATQMAYEDRAYAAILTPDGMISDGTVVALQRHAVDGVQLVWTAALRLGEEPLFEHLKQLGITAPDSSFGDGSRSLVVSGRQLVWAAIRSFHSEVLCCEWEKPYFPRFQSAVWWRVPGEDGIIVHALSWAPLLIDYAAVKHHDTSTMDDAAIDGDYIHRNLGLNARMYIVQDSDEIMHASWGPLSDRAVPLEPVPEQTGRFSGKWERGMWLYDTLHGSVSDPLKRKIFTVPVYWHTGDIDQKKWNAVEKKASSVIRKYGLRETLSGQVTAVIVKLMRNWRYVTTLLVYYWGTRRQTMGLAIQAIKGDPVARKRVKHGFMLIVNRLTH